MSWWSLITLSFLMSSCLMRLTAGGLVSTLIKSAVWMMPSVRCDKSVSTSTRDCVRSGWLRSRQPRCKFQHLVTPLLCLSLYFCPFLVKQISSIPFLLVDNAFVNNSCGFILSANLQMFLYSLIQSKINDSGCYQHPFVLCDICGQKLVLD